MSDNSSVTESERAKYKADMQRAASALQYAGRQNTRNPANYSHFSDSRMQKRIMQIMELKVTGIAKESTTNVNMQREGWDKYFFFADNPVRNLGRKRPARIGDNSFGDGKEELKNLVKVYATKKPSDSQVWCPTDGTIMRDDYRRWSGDCLPSQRPRDPATYLKHIFPDGHRCFDEILANLDHKRAPPINIARTLG